MNDLPLKVFYETNEKRAFHLDERADQIAEEHGGARLFSGLSGDGLWRDIVYVFRRESDASEARDEFLWDGFILDCKPNMSGSINIAFGIEAVELRPAFAWDCPSCGREQFERGVVPEMSPEDLQELRVEHGVQPWETGDFLMMPKTVQCSHCSKRFSAARFGAEDDE